MGSGSGLAEKKPASRTTGSVQWHPELIKAAIRMRGTTPEALSKKAGLDPSAFGKVIRGQQRWRKVELAIARFLRVPASELWPDSHFANARSRARKRPHRRAA